MSKRKRTSFNYTPSQKLPRLRRIKTEWDLKKYYYSSHNDPRIEKDVVGDERAYENFAKKYASRNFTKDSKSLLQALKDYERLSIRSGGAKVMYYFEYRLVLNVNDAVAQKRLNLVSERLRKAANKVLFFELTLGKIPKKKQKVFLADEELTFYHYFLKRVFLEAEHNLSETEEKLWSLLSGPSHGMWEAMTEQIVSNREIVFDKKRVAIPEALELINSVPPKQKTTLWNSILDEMEQISEVAEHELNAIVTRQKVSDELRGYEQPYSSTVQAYENDEQSVASLVDAVNEKGFKLSREFYKLKAKYHGKKQLPYEHKYLPIGDDPTVPFETAVEVCRDAFYGIKKEYGEFFDRMLEGGNIDAFPKKGKRGGAFMSYNIKQPIFVFLNHTSDFSSLQTLAHEMGHGLHSERSKKQKPFYERYTITTAETVSTLLEGIAFEKLLEAATPIQKRNLLHDKITRNIATIQRQIAFFNFELEMHNRIRNEGALTKDELAKMLAKHYRSYLGPRIGVTERDGLSFVYVHHFRSIFYVYTYAYGILLSNIMHQNLVADPTYINKIDAFLSAGGSNSVEEIFKMIGINAYKKETFLESLRGLEQDIKNFKALI